MNPRLPFLLLSLIAASASAADAPATAPKAATNPAAPAAPATAAPAASTSKSPTPAAPAPAAGRNNAAAAAPAETFESKFRVITDRNIFNANRIPGRRDSGPVAVAPRTDVITLYGVTDDDKGLRAFFDGTDSAYRKKLQVGESLDKFKITKIEPKVVTLERDGKTISVTVGQQLRRPEGGDWNVSAMETSSRPAASATTSSRPEASAPESDLERRMRERRANQK
jgi:hypothetical protein